MTDRDSPASALPPDEPELAELKRRGAVWWQPLVLLVLLGIAFFLVDRLGLTSDLVEVRQWIDSLGLLGPVAFVAIFTVVTMLAFPATPLTVAAGALFGAGPGIAISLAASTLSATLSFLVARYLAPTRLHLWLARTRPMRRLDRLMQRRGGPVVLVARLVYVLPFPLLNYGFGFTRVPLRTYVVWSLFGKVPGTVVAVVGVDVVIRTLTSQRVPWALVALVVGIALALAAAIPFAGRWLREAERDQDEDGQ
ncbi:MAG: TVP38/TMEM64 family protein [Phycisphaeraceae bacterium]